MHPLGCLLLTLLAIVRGVLSQPLPWPPLVTTCDIMPLVAADITLSTKGELTCASTNWPDCETINCNVVSNSEQLEIVLLPCYEYPGVWLRSRPINGTPHTQHVFYKDSELFNTKIGDLPVTLNVTLVQRNKLTLGLQVVASYGMKGENITLIPYRDIPLNTSFCPPVNAPLTCEVLQFIEQYIIVQNAAKTHDPDSTPLCPRPDIAHCTSITCNWPPSPMSSQTIKLELLPCATPPAVTILVANAKEGLYFNHTFDKSEIVKLHLDVMLNVTLTHPLEGVVGLEVVSMESESVFTEIAFVRIPLPNCKYVTNSSSANKAKEDGGYERIGHFPSN